MAVYLTLRDVWSVPDAVRCNGNQVEKKVLPGRYRMIEIEHSPFKYGGPGPYWIFDPAQFGFEGSITGYPKSFWQLWHAGHGSRHVLIEEVPDTT